MKYLTGCSSKNGQFRVVKIKIVFPMVKKKPPVTFYCNPKKCPLFGSTPCISLGTHALVHPESRVTFFYKRRWRTPVAVATSHPTTCVQL